MQYVKQEGSVRAWGGGEGGGGIGLCQQCRANDEPEVELGREHMVFDLDVGPGLRDVPAQAGLII